MDNQEEADQTNQERHKKSAPMDGVHSHARGDEANPKSHQAAENPKGKIKKLLEAVRREPLGTAGVLVAAVAVMFTALQWRAAIETNRSARAWLTVNKIDLIGKLEPDSTVFGGLEWSNSGSSPALEVQPRVKLQIRPYAQPPEFDLGAPPSQSSGVIGRDQPFPLITDGIRLNPTAVAAVATGQARVIIVGEFRYRDVFFGTWLGTPTRCTKFCFEWPRVPGLTSDTKWRACDTGNSAN